MWSLSRRRARGGGLTSEVVAIINSLFPLSGFMVKRFFFFCPYVFRSIASMGGRVSREI